MSVCLIDSNVLIDILSGDPVWSKWSSAQLEKAADEGTAAINPIIYAESAMVSDAIEDFDASIALLKVVFLELPVPALFMASRVYLNYRRRGGRRSAILPDFLIGAHAAVSGFTLVTRDRRRRAWFLTVKTILPP